MFGLPPILAHIVELTVAALLMAVAAGTGLAILRLLRLSQRLSTGERLVFGTALGLGAMSFLMLGLGLTRLLYLPAALAGLLALSMVAVTSLWREWPRMRHATKGSFRALRYPPLLFLVTIVIVCLFSALVKALLPVATQDDLMYHLALPRRYIEAHGIDFYADSTYSLFPQLMEMLYTWGLLLGSDRIAVLLALSTTLLGPAAAALFAKRYLATPGTTGGRVLPVLVAAIFLSVPLVGYVMRAANTDLPQASFDFLAIYAFWLAVIRPSAAKRESIGKAGSAGAATVDSTPQVYEKHAPFDLKLLLLAGLCCGLSFSTKYYGFAVATILGIALVTVARYRRLKWRMPLAAFVPAMGAFAGGVVFLALPWLVRNVVESGNPVWPLAGRIFGGAYWSPTASPETLLGSAPPFGPANLWTGVEFVWNAATRPPILIDRQWHNVDLSLLLLPALLLLPFARWKPALTWIAVAGASYWLIWALFFSRTSARYLSTFFLLCAVLGAYAIVEVFRRFRVTRWGLVGGVAALLAMLGVQAVVSTGPYLGTTFSLERSAESDYLRQYMEDYPMIRFIEGNTPTNAKVYVWDGQPRGYYIPRDYVYARLVPLYSGFGSEPEAWRERLRELGITHVLVHRRDILAPGQPLGVDPALEVGRRFGQRYFSPPLFRVGNFTIYELAP
jgi:hypothetical protein